IDRKGSTLTTPNARTTRLLIRTSKLLCCFFVVPACILAQAWLYPKGEGGVSLSYQNLFVRDHVFSKGETLDAGQIRSQALVLDVDYSLTRRLAVRIGLPYIAAEYSGLRPHRLPTDSGIQYTFLDDGTYHPTFQDFRVDLRYSLSTRKFALTPFFEVVVP